MFWLSVYLFNFFEVTQRVFLLSTYPFRKLNVCLSHTIHSCPSPRPPHSPSKPLGCFCFRPCHPQEHSLATAESSDQSVIGLWIFQRFSLIVCEIQQGLASSLIRTTPSRRVPSRLYNLMTREGFLLLLAWLTPH